MIIQSYLHSRTPSFHHSTHTHLLEHSDTRAYPSHRLNNSFFPPCGLSVLSIYVSPVSCKIGVLSADGGRCSFRVMRRVVRDDSLSSLIQGCLHRQLAGCRQRSKWPLCSESNDKAVCIRSHKDSALSFICNLKQTHAHTHTFCKCIM